MRRQRLAVWFADYQGEAPGRGWKEYNEARLALSSVKYGKMPPRTGGRSGILTEKSPKTIFSLIKPVTIYICSSKKFCAEYTNFSN
jgi:hypothetical protein